MTRNDHLYTLDNAKRFGWASISGELNPERLNFLRDRLVGKRILDVGCGGGGYVEQLCRDGFEAIGADRSEEFLSFARERPNRRGEYVVADILDLPFPDNSFDTVFCFDVLEHVDDAAAIRELSRVSRSSVVLSVPLEDTQLIRYGITLVHYMDKTHLREYNDSRLRELLAANVRNLEHLEIVPEGQLNFSWIISELLDSVSATNTAVEWLHRRIASKLARRAKFPKIFSGLLADVSLAK